MIRSRTRMVKLAASLAAAASLGCDKVPANALQSCDASQVTPGSVKTDILFVIDNSGSMAEEQADLQAALADFVSELSSSPVKDDFQVGVTTTSVATGAAGSLVGAGIMPGGSATLVSDFESTAVVGTSGDWWEEPFEAAKLAIEKSAAGGPNAGFIRPGSRLAIFFMSDEDDCSNPTRPSSDSACRTTEKTNGTLTPVSDYVDFLRAPILGETKDVVVYAVAGFSPDTLALSCGNTGICADNTCATAADEGDRFLALAQAFGTSGRIGSICATSSAMATMLTEFAGVIMSQTMPLQGAPADPGLLVVKVTKAATGETVSCGPVAWAGTSGAATANVVYTPPQSGSPASLSFQFDCALGHGDQVDVQVVCVR